MARLENLSAIIFLINKVAITEIWNLVWVRVSFMVNLGLD